MVDYIEEDQEFTIASTYSTANLWHLDRIDQTDLPLNRLSSSPNDSSNVDIYILDTGKQLKMVLQYKFSTQVMSHAM